MKKSLHLVAAELCPYAQRVWFTLLYKNFDFSYEFIDLKNPPEDFLLHSPQGQVPLLFHDQRPLFESMVVVEYLDALVSPSLLPEDHYQQAWLRAWSAVAGDLLYKQYQWFMEKDQAELEGKGVVLQNALSRFLKNFSHRDDFLTGKQMTLLDIACAPLWLRFAVIKTAFHFDFLDNFQGMEKIWQTLSALPMMEKTKAIGFSDRFIAHLQTENSALLP
jgi:glutathione S-transferase